VRHRPAIDEHRARRQRVRLPAKDQLTGTASDKFDRGMWKAATVDFVVRAAVLDAATDDDQPSLERGIQREIEAARGGDLRAEIPRHVPGWLERPAAFGTAWLALFHGLRRSWVAECAANRKSKSDTKKSKAAIPTLASVIYFD
jgi:hypothetical protein